MKSPEDWDADPVSDEGTIIVMACGVVTLLMLIVVLVVIGIAIFSGTRFS